VARPRCLPERRVEDDAWLAPAPSRTREEDAEDAGMASNSGMRRLSVACLRHNNAVVSSGTVGNLNCAWRRRRVALSAAPAAPSLVSAVVEGESAVPFKV